MRQEGAALEDTWQLSIYCKYPGSFLFTVSIFSGSFIFTVSIFSGSFLFTVSIVSGSCPEIWSIGYVPVVLIFITSPLFQVSF